MNPESNTNKVWNVIGIGVNGSGIIIKAPKPVKIANITAEINWFIVFVRISSNCFSVVNNTKCYTTGQISKQYLKKKIGIQKMRRINNNRPIESSNSLINNIIVLSC